MKLFRPFYTVGNLNYSLIPSSAKRNANSLALSRNALKRPLAPPCPASIFVYNNK